MQKFSQFLNKPSVGASEALLLIDKEVTGFLSGSRALGLNPAACATAIGLLGMGMLGWLNLHAASAFNFEFIYLLACAVVGWLAGAGAGFICTIAACLLQFFEEVAGLNESPASWIFWCNSLLRLTAFVSISWLAAEVGRLSRRQERALQDHTARLQSEVTEHKQTADWLQEAMHLFQQAAENISSVVWVSDATRTEIQYVSPEFENVWGESRQTLYLSPSTWLERVHPEDCERVARAMISRQVRGEYDEEYRVVRTDGSLRWVHDRAFPVKDDAGAVYRIVGIAEDITERKRTERLLQAERDIGVALSSTSDLRFALERLLEIALQLEGIDCGGVYLADPETGELRLEAHRGLSESFVERVARYRPDAPEAHLAKAGHSVYMRRDQIPRALKVFWGSEGLRSVAIVPLQHQGTVLGMLNLGSYRNDEILPRTRIGIEMIASQVAGALARIRAEDSLRRSDAHLRTIINHAPLALLATDAKGMLTFEDGRALPAMGFQAGQHLRRPVTELFADFPLALENVRRASLGEEFSSVLEFADTAFECRYSPMRDARRDYAGFIAVATDVTERFRLQREILEISDREQARIGQDIHDGLCQQLIGLAFRANNLEQSLSADRRPEAESARKLCELLDEAITESRRVCRGLYPIRLTTEGLVPALEELARTTCERYGVSCRCEAQESRLNCGLATATHLYRIAQEAVNNVIKHSGARNIAIQIADVDQGTALRVKDDGKGLAQPRAGNSGMGLHIMAYRARLIGGNLDIRGDCGGTLVSCVVPSLVSHQES